MAYQENNTQFVTSRECADRIRKVSDFQPVTLTTTSQALPVTRHQIVNTMDGLSRIQFARSTLRALPGNSSQAHDVDSDHLATDDPPTEAPSADYKIWFPKNDSDSTSFDSVATDTAPDDFNLKHDQQVRYMIFDEYPELVSGSPVFKGGQPICISSAIGTCHAYHSTLRNQTLPPPGCKPDNKRDDDPRFFYECDITSDICRYNCESGSTCDYSRGEPFRIILANGKAKLHFHKALDCDASGTRCRDDDRDNYCTQGACDFLGGCLFGCNYAERREMGCNTMPTVYIGAIAAAGAVIIVVAAVLIAHYRR